MSAQTQEMRNFILQEAHEKVNELRVKTEYEFNLEKSALAARGKAAIDEDHQARMRDLQSHYRM